MNKIQNKNNKKGAAIVCELLPDLIMTQSHFSIEFHVFRFILTSLDTRVSLLHANFIITNLLWRLIHWFNTRTVMIWPHSTCCPIAAKHMHILHFIFHSVSAMSVILLRRSGREAHVLCSSHYNAFARSLKMVCSYCDLLCTIKLTVCCFMFLKCFHSAIKFIAAWWMVIFIVLRMIIKRNGEKIGYVWWLREKNVLAQKKSTHAHTQTTHLFSCFLMERANSMNEEELKKNANRNEIVLLVAHLE